MQDNTNIVLKKGNKRLLLVVVALLFISAVALLLYYYREKIILLYNDPAAFWDLLLTATQLKSFTLLSLITTFSVIFIGLLVDLLSLGWQNSAIRRLTVNPTQSSKTDLLCFFLAVTRLFQVLQFCISLGIAYFISSLFMRYLNLNLMGYIHIPVVQPLVLFILLDLKHYLEHRFMHTRKFWELHAYHHSATEFTLLTNARGHLLEETVYMMFTGIFFALMGTGMHEIFIAYAFREMYGYILHADIKSNMGWVGKWVLMSPPAHKLHHSVNPEDYGKNFGTLFVWWDKLFRTYKNPPAEIQIGLTDDIYNQTHFFKGQLIGFKRWINSW